ncbi:MAG: hypothetical protein DYG88_08695 [Chloroflexi bacterium CFX4]|nr:hypothetical protein [Chloroflexi bacterium CFX4]
MLSTKCTSCGQLISLKNEEIKAAIAQVEEAKQSHYQMPCPKCRRPVKITLKMLRLRLPREMPAPPTE